MSAPLRALWSVAIVLAFASCSNGGSTAASASSTQIAKPRVAFTDAPDLSRETRENPRPTPAPQQRLSSSPRNSAIHDLMEKYASLRSRVTVIIAAIGAGGNNESILQSSGSSWYDDERSFQSAIDTLPGNLRTVPQYMLVKGNMAEAEEFLYSAGVDAMASCNAGNARRELQVADYFVDAVKHEMSTGVATSEDAADPPQVDSAADLCHG